EKNSGFEELVAAGKAVFIPNDKSNVISMLESKLKRDISITNSYGYEIPDILYHHRVIGNKYIFFVSNVSRETTHFARISFGIRGKISEWDAVSGNISPVLSLYNGSYSVIDCEFPPVGSHIFIIEKGGRIQSVKKRPKQKSVLSINNTWKFKRVHPNSLTLDYCEYCIDNSSWSKKVPVWQAREAVIEASGMKPYKGIQPWVLLQKGIKPNPVDVELRYKFLSEIKDADISLVIEKASNFIISVNNQPVSTDNNNWHWDRQFGKINISKHVKKGDNIINLRCTYNSDVEIEDIYLIGDFAVKFLNTSKFALTNEPDNLLTGSWVNQGYSFYAGNMLYRNSINLAKIERVKHIFLHIKNPCCSLLRVSVNNNEAGLLAWQPWEIDIKKFLKNGANTIEIEVVGSLRNTFGPLHHIGGDKLQWVGPGEFSDIANWTDTYHFATYGILGGAELVTY
ncbi:MAG: hypothetical protein ABIH42_03800, partial [Planctomycetota bacterium]